MLRAPAPRARHARWELDYTLHKGLHALRGDLPARHAFQRLIAVVRSTSSLLHLNPIGGQPLSAQALHVVPGLVALCRHARSWLRNVESWRAPATGRHEQFASLAAHLLAVAPVPPFMARVWLEAPCRLVWQHQKWYRHLGRGHDIRGVHLPLAFDRPMAAAFRDAPDDLTVHQALRWAQIRGLGGSPTLARVIAGTRLGIDLSHDEYWQDVIRLLIRHPRVGAEHAMPLVEYLHAWRAASQTPPALRDETLGAVLRSAGIWWKKHCRAQREPALRWPPSPIRRFRLTEPGSCPWSVRYWTIEELLDSRELRQEGQALHHCVGSYSSLCAARRSSIWSVRCHGERSVQRMATLEVDPTKWEIVTARGLCNARLKNDVRAVMLAWADREGLAVASWV